MAGVTMTVQLEGDAPSVADAAHRLGLDRTDLDDEFGVVSIDPENHLFAVLVDAEAATRAAPGDGVAGPFSNPPIEPFGPGPE